MVQPTTRVCTCIELAISSMASTSDSTFTPRRSPRLASKRGTISTPVRDSLRIRLLARSEPPNRYPSSVCQSNEPRSICASASSSSCSFLLGILHDFICESECYSSLKVEDVQADVGNNQIRRFLTVNRSLMCYDDDLGPYHGLRLNISENGNYKLLVYDKLLEEDVVSVPISPTSAIVSSLNILASKSHIVCPGVKSYYVYKESIGYDLKRVMTTSCPPNSVRDNDCSILYQKDPCSRSEAVCKICVSLKWLLTKRKREHDKFTPMERVKRQGTSSTVSFDILSPESQKARLENMKKTSLRLRKKAVYYYEKIERLTADDKQNQEVGELVEVVVVVVVAVVAMRKIVSMIARY